MIDHAEARVTVYECEHARKGEPPWVARYEPLNAEGRAVFGATEEVPLDAWQIVGALAEASERFDVNDLYWDRNPDGAYIATAVVADGLATVITDEPEMRLIVQPRVSNDPHGAYDSDPVVDVTVPDDNPPRRVTQALESHGWRELPQDWEWHDYGISCPVVRTEG